MWTTAFAPFCSSQLIGNEVQIGKIKEYLFNFNPKSGKALLISGLPGIGKTTATVICARECGYVPIIKNASE